jgi:iron complex transport system ATP-binding protein
MNHAPRLIASDLEFAYVPGEWRLRVPELILQAGEIAALTGPNGSGKSTLLQLIAGVLVPQTGRIQLDGEEIGGMERRRIARLLGYLPQEPHSQFDYRVSEIVSMGRYPHGGFGGFLREEDWDVIEACMKRMEVDAFAERRVSRLSGGERRRVFLASVLAQEPLVLLLDEPASSLDMHHQVRLFSMIRELAHQGMTVLAVTHDLNLASHFCERVILMNQGAIIADGTPNEVFTAERLETVYGSEILLAAHPQTGRPAVFPHAVFPQAMEAPQ